MYVVCYYCIITLEKSYLSYGCASFWPVQFTIKRKLAGASIELQE